MQRAERLLTQVEHLHLTLNSCSTLRLTASVAGALPGRNFDRQGFHPEISEQEAGYFDLRRTSSPWTTEEAIPLEEKAIQLNPRSSLDVRPLRDIGYACYCLVEDQRRDHLLRTIACTQPGQCPLSYAMTFRRLAAAYARIGQMSAAKRALVEADRLWPYDTVRAHWPNRPWSLHDPPSTIATAGDQALPRRATPCGERDHADEDADFGVVADATLHSTSRV